MSSLAVLRALPSDLGDMCHQGPARNVPKQPGMALLLPYAAYYRHSRLLSLFYLLWCTYTILSRHELLPLKNFKNSLLTVYLFMK